ncbi:hypothetical protein B005_5532 [Nocardiopsis alba ATCC BAA-2165]|uniref:Uncharacterized protein n=1 Tax=Nocardiopsis alba (strain ATCC BAA-2165 / BE74) TaxID=1205910 RepID=J7LDP6_NOCAA|nr:hypothetical protein B005_5532 [Nocardiopsis alba ATCC BAA-2165]
MSVDDGSAWRWVIVVEAAVSVLSGLPSTVPRVSMGLLPLPRSVRGI